MAQIKFDDIEIEVSVVLLGKNRQSLDIKEGIIDVPKSVTPNAFSLILSVSEEANIVFAQKNLKEDRGGYKDPLSHLSLLGRRMVVAEIPVCRPGSGEKVWTSWSQERPNRVDCWILEGTKLGLFQVGIVTHDNGVTFRLLGEFIWKGELFHDAQKGIVGKPLDPEWGSFEIRRKILDFPDFKKLLDQTELPPWNGKEEDLNPPLALARGKKQAIVDWFNPFAGQAGQGIAILYDGSQAWVHGTHLNIEPCEDGIKRLRRGQVLTFLQIEHNWGSGKSSTPKLLNVKVKRISQAPVQSC